VPFQNDFKLTHYQDSHLPAFIAYSCSNPFLLRQAKQTTL